MKALEPLPTASLEVSLGISDFGPATFGAWE